MNTFHIYTDGGCRGNQEDNNIGAYGAYMRFNEYEHSIAGGERNTTNNIMELKGCIEGLKQVKYKQLPVKVYVDSAYVLNGITKWLAGWKVKGWKTASKKPVANKELWIELDGLVQTFDNIEFIKVKGHSDNEGNNKADALCNEYMDKMEEI